jgi:hypothetical protein
VTESSERPAVEAAPAGEIDQAARRRFAPPPLLASVAVAVALVALIFTWRRLFLGTDLSDEGFYVAVPYRLALGARPFVDEMSILQTAEFFVLPFVKLYVWLTGGANGIVLFTRHLYLAWATIVSLVACLGLQKLVRWEHALAASLVCMTFVFVSTTDLSYNTLGAGFLVIGMALGAHAVGGRGGDRWLAAAGVAQALAVLAYPTLALALPVTAVCLALSMRDGRWQALRAWAIGAGATLVAEALLLVSFGVANVLRCVRWELHGWSELNGTSGPAKLWGLVAGVIRHVELYPLIVVAALVVWLAYRRWPVARLALVLTPLALLPFGEQLVSGADGFGVIYGLAAPYFYLFVPDERRALATRLLVWGYLPALAAGLVSGYSSANSWLQMDVGLLPAMVLSGVFLALALAPRVGEGQRLRKVLPGLALACLAGILAVTVVYQFQFLPRAVPYSQLTVTLHGGPYAGIRTTPARAAYLEQLRADLSRVAGPSDRLLFFYQVPALYLFWPHRTAANSVWITSVKGFEANDDTGPLPPATLAYYERERTLPDVVVRVVGTAGLSAQELEQRYCGGLGYRLVLVRSQYAIFRRPSDVTTVADVPQPVR